MIWLVKPDHPKATEFAPAMDEDTGILPGLPSVKGKPVQVAFDGGRMTSDAGILLLAAIEQRLGIAERLADCIEDPRAPERVRHGLAEMIRYRALLIAAGYPDGNAIGGQIASFQYRRQPHGSSPWAKGSRGGRGGRAHHRRHPRPLAAGAHLVAR